MVFLGFQITSLLIIRVGAHRKVPNFCFFIREKMPFFELPCQGAVKIAWKWKYFEDRCTAFWDSSLANTLSYLVEGGIYKSGNQSGMKILQIRLSHQTLTLWPLRTVEVSQLVSHLLVAAGWPALWQEPWRDPSGFLKAPGRWSLIQGVIGICLYRN